MVVGSRGRMLAWQFAKVSAAFLSLGPHRARAADESRRAHPSARWNGLAYWQHASRVCCHVDLAVATTFKVCDARLESVLPGSSSMYCIGGVRTATLLCDSLEL